jgi:excisionase family DNA binding protein
MSTTTAIPEPPFDASEAARRLGVTDSWLREHRHEVPFIRMGRFRRYTQAHLDSYLARRTVDPDPLARSERSKAPARRAS